MKTQPYREEFEDTQSCNLTREQGRQLVIKGAKIIREGKELAALGAKTSVEGLLQLFFFGASKIFIGIKEDGYKDFM